jgi:pimeloyl-ACP methyl ester carboxylesterase
MHLKTDLLLLHGALGASSQMLQIGTLLSPDFNIHYLDFPGHGVSPLDKETEFSIELFSDRLIEFVTANDLKGCDVFGYSMGGYVALYSAAKDPELFNRITTLGTKFKWDPETAANEVKNLDPEKIITKVPAFANRLEELHRNRWKQVLSKTSAMMIGLGEKNVLTDELFDQIENECYITLGEKDKMVTLEETKDAVLAMPNAELRSLPDTPHPIDQVSSELLASYLVFLLA